MRRFWIFPAGKQGERELAAIEQSKLFSGFLEVGNLKKYKDRNAILEHLKDVMPEAGQNQLRNIVAQPNQFAHSIQTGDLA